MQRALSALFITAFFSLFCASWGKAADMEMEKALSERFAPVNARIVATIDNSYLIELDPAGHLKAGDLLTFHNTAEQVLHPITKEVLGEIKEPAGFLQIKKVNAAIAFAKVIYSRRVPKIGEAISSFTDIPAFFAPTKTEATRPYRDKIISALPQMHWLSDEKQSKPLLLFKLTGARIEVATFDNTLLFQRNLESKQ